MLIKEKTFMISIDRLKDTFGRLRVNSSPLHFSSSLEVGKQRGEASAKKKQNQEQEQEQENKVKIGKEEIKGKKFITRSEKKANKMRPIIRPSPQFSVTG
uniref:Uncharacterized protein n=1 Tax=Tetranychus urticae TaxID=32264 RepID=T1JWP9_TETUR